MASALVDCQLARRFPWMEPMQAMKLALWYLRANAGKPEVRGEGVSVPDRFTVQLAELVIADFTAKRLVEVDSSWKFVRELRATASVAVMR